ncbi:MAG: Sapep family Mn(2+)-dependent dipeptidase [Olsenella sp.]|nr:Sapep family Mn(2+)-dependent dipeptidase [Olsenella sp.]MCI1289302.1 Sapep family Mn(2+)-dependent dipeptidase [Olsenella sp.]
MSDEELEREADAYVDEVWEDVVADIRTLVRIPSVRDREGAKPGMPWGKASHDALVAALGIASRLGLDAHECEGYIGYADLKGASDTQIATIAHTDVVPEGLGWTVDPFDVTRREGYLLGRGVLDDKGPFVLSLYAANFFRRKVEATGKPLPYTLRCLVGNEEECEMGDLKWYLKHYPEPAFCFTPDADFPLICGEKGVFHGHFTAGRLADEPGARIVSMDAGTVANAIPGQAEAVVRAATGELQPREGVEVEEKGDGTCLVRTHGIGGHASLPAGTRNAIGMLADYLLDNGVCNEPERSFLSLEHLLCAASTDGSSLGIASADEKFGPLTCIGGTVRTVDGGFVQTMDARYPTSITDGQIEEALSRLAAEHRCTFDVDGVKMPFYIDPSSAPIKTLLDTYAEYSGQPAEAQVIGGGTYARNFTCACAFGANDPTATLPSWVGPEHGPDEGVAEGTLKQALRIYIVSIARLMRLEF